MVDIPERTEPTQSAPSRGTLWLERGSLCLGVVALLALSYRYMDLLGDSFWSVATGRYILQHGRLPTSDPFSFTANRPWIVHMPLSQVCFAWVEAHFGILSLELFGALLSTAALSLIWFPHSRGMPARCVTFAALLWLIFLQADDLCVRGQLFGDLAFAVLLVCMFRLRAGKAVQPWFACLLGSAWMNLHSSAFLGLVLPLAWAALTRLERSPPLLLPYLKFAAAFGVGLFLNPYGPRLVIDVWQLLRAESTQQIDLFRPPDFGAPTTWVTFLLVGLATAACFRRARLQAGAGLSEALLLVLWAVAAATARRYLPLALMFAVAVGARELSARWAPHAEPTERRGALVWVLALTIVAAGTAFFGLSTDKDPFRDVPLEEATIIERLPLPDHVANIYHWGGFLDYAWDGRRKTFIDGRNQLFEHGAFADEQRLASLQDWAEVLTRYRINTVLWERNSPLDFALSQSSDWQPVRRGRIAVIYVRKQPLPVPP